MARVGRPVLVSLLLVWGLAIGLLTLRPTPTSLPLTLAGFLCIGCGARDTADILANWAVFLPGGALATLLFGSRRALVWALTLAAAIESLQVGIPGRDPALQDLLSNGAGALSGVLLLRSGLGIGGRRALSAVAAVAWLAPTVLMIPLSSSATLYGQWTPAFSEMETYRGRVVSAAVGGVPVRNGRLAEDSVLDDAIVGRLPIELVLEMGSPPSRAAPVFQIVDTQRVTVVSVTARGQDLIVSGRSPATVLKLDQPTLHWRRATQGTAPGDTVDVTVERGLRSGCISLGDRQACGLGPSLGDGWKHLAALETSPVWIGALLSLAWPAGLGALWGLSFSAGARAMVAATVLALTGIVAAVLSPDVRLDLIQTMILVVASPLGIVLGQALDRMVARANSQSLPPDSSRDFR